MIILHQFPCVKGVSGLNGLSWGHREFGKVIQFLQVCFIVFVQLVQTQTLSMWVGEALTLLKSISFLAVFFFSNLLLHLDELQWWE